MSKKRTFTYKIDITKSKLFNEITAEIDALRKKISMLQEEHVEEVIISLTPTSKISFSVPKNLYNQDHSVIDNLIGDINSVVDDAFIEITSISLEDAQKLPEFPCKLNSSHMGTITKWKNELEQRLIKEGKKISPQEWILVENKYVTLKKIIVTISTIQKQAPQNILETIDNHLVINQKLFQARINAIQNEFRLKKLVHELNGNPDDIFHLNKVRYTKDWSPEKLKGAFSKSKDQLKIDIANALDLKYVMFQVFLNRSFDIDEFNNIKNFRNIT